MTTTPARRSARWRTLHATELATSPDARLGGALAVMFWCAIALVALLVLMITWLIAPATF